MQDILRAKQRGVPIVMVECADPEEVARNTIATFNGKTEVGFLSWNCIDGLRGMNEKGTAMAGAVENSPDMTAALNSIKGLENAVVFAYGAGPGLSDGSLYGAAIRQAVYNLRDEFKSKQSMLVLLVGTGTPCHADLKDHVIPLNMPLPGADRLQSIATEVLSAAQVDMTDSLKTRIIDCTLGLSAFTAEQCIAMSTNKDGVDLNSLWERKRKAIEQTPGLSVWREGDSFEDIGGCSSIKEFLRKYVVGKNCPRVVVWIDEIEKHMAGNAGDLSGTTQEMTGALLSTMQDKQYRGLILVGVAGSGKSAICKATGTEAGCPTIAFDLSGMKGSLVGESGARLRSALATVNSIGQGKVLVLATCNKIASLPPELRRRFSLGTFFFDLPTEEERKAIWRIWTTKFDIDIQPIPDDAGWTGAEIRQCCDVADSLGIKLREAGKWVVPVSRSAAADIEDMRKQASGRYLSASEPGLYQYVQQSTSGRRMKL